MKVETQTYWSFPRAATATQISRFDQKTQPFVKLDQDDVNKKRPRMNFIFYFWIIFIISFKSDIDFCVSIWICSNLIIRVYLWILSNRRKLHAWVRVWKICIFIIQNENRKNLNWPHLIGPYVNGLYLLALIRSVPVWTFRFGSLSSWFRRKSRNCYFYRS